MCVCVCVCVCKRAYIIYHRNITPPHRVRPADGGRRTLHARTHAERGARFGDLHTDKMWRFGKLAHKTRLRQNPNSLRRTSARDIHINSDRKQNYYTLNVRYFKSKFVTASRAYILYVYNVHMLVYSIYLYIYI